MNAMRSIRSCALWRLDDLTSLLSGSVRINFAARSVRQRVFTFAIEKKVSRAPCDPEKAFLFFASHSRSVFAGSPKALKRKILRRAGLMHQSATARDPVHEIGERPWCSSLSKPASRAVPCTVCGQKSRRSYGPLRGFCFVHWSADRNIHSAISWRKTIARARLKSLSRGALGISSDRPGRPNEMVAPDGFEPPTKGL